MTRDEIKTYLEDIGNQIDGFNQDETQLYAELGRKVLPQLEEGEYSELVAEIKEIEEKLSFLKNEQSSLESDYKKRVADSTCFYCKTVNTEGGLFCEECGKKLGEKPKEYCEACGTMNHPGQKFCGECGGKLPE